MTATRAQCLAAAKAKWGPRAAIQENDGALTPAGRVAAQARHMAIVARRKEIAEIVKAKTYDYKTSDLLKACRFVVDVDGDDPSIPEMRSILERAEKTAELNAEEFDLRKEAQTLGLWRFRWDAGYIGNIPDVGRYFSCNVSANTLDELLAKIG